MPHLFAGTSGFAYASWKPDFYPPGLRAKEFLSCYSQRLNSVEINYTFRRLPSATTVENWIRSTPPRFIFSLKAPMRITHILRLKEASGAVEAFLNSVAPLGRAGKLGAILFQFPPQMRCDLERLKTFLPSLPKDNRYAFEFRHESWLSPPVYDLLQEHGTALCVAESEKLEVPDVVTAKFVYYRFRKPDYTPQERQVIAARVQKLLSQRKDVFVFFKHEESPQGALYAEELLQKMQRI